MNAEISNNGTEVYASRLFELVDSYVDERLEGKEDDVGKNFRDMVFYIADRLERPDNSDIEGLDCLFGAYVRLCTRFGRLPTLECFSWLVGIDRNVFTRWAKGECRAHKYYTMDGEPINNLAAWMVCHRGEDYRTEASTVHSGTVKKWLEICRGFVVDELSNSKAVNPNLIFTAKSAYGLRETSPVPPPETENRRILTAAELPKLEDVATDFVGSNAALPYLAGTEPDTTAE